ncbi:ABC transporter ATP-binding protein [Micromonosporaceae bacterium B7E4]
MTGSRGSTPSPAGENVPGAQDGRDGVDAGPPAAVRGLCRRLIAGLSLSMRAAPAAMAGCVVLTVAAGGLPVATAWLTKLVLDRLAGGAGLGVLINLGVWLAAVGVVAGVVPHITQYLAAELDRAVGLLAQDRLYSAVDSLVGLGRFENPHFLDRLRLAQQAGRMAPTQTLAGVMSIARSTITLTGLFGSLVVLSPVMAGLVLVAAVPTLVGEIVMSRRRAEMFWEIGSTERREIFYADLLSSVHAAKEVRLFGIGGFLRQRMLADRRTTDAAKRAIDRQDVVIQTGLSLLAAVVSGAGLLWAVHAAQRGTLSIGDIAMFVAAVAGVQAALAGIAVDMARTHEVLLLFDHYLAVTTAGPDLPTAAAVRQLPALRHGIELRDVWFRYSDEHPWVLRGVSLRIPHGQATGLVGLNGAGKSTLVKLLCRFYDPTRGSITWDGVDIRAADPAQLRNRLTAVFQDYMHYDMTAAENIGLGDLDAFDDHQRIQTAARRAGIHDKLATLPRGYQTILSRTFFREAEKADPETGVLLSGGQWQRVALARAFLRDRRDLLILDEPSAGLDAEAEYEIHTSLRNHRVGQSSLLISHRLSAVRDADNIVVLSEGRVAEQGDHATLLAAGGLYARLFTMQASGYQAESEAELVAHEAPAHP